MSVPIDQGIIGMMLLTWRRNIEFLLVIKLLHKKKAEEEKDRIFKKRNGTGLAEAVIESKSDVSLNELWSDLNEDSKGVWLALDQIQDPHNVGAIFRSAAFFGIKGLILDQGSICSYEFHCLPMLLQVGLSMFLSPFSPISVGPLHRRRIRGSGLWERRSMPAKVLKKWIGIETG